MTTSTTVESDGARLHVITEGEGPAVLLLHGFPHTWRVWSAVIPTLAETHRVIAPDLRGLGDSERAVSGYDARSLAGDALCILDALDVDHAAVVAIDAAVTPAFMLALENPDRVDRLVLMEGMIGALPGAEAFVPGGPPWWFGFHAVPDLAETVLEGHESEYIEYFLRTGTHDGRGVEPEIRDAFIEAYRGRHSLRSAFEHYRALAANAAQVAQAVRTRRLRVPTLAIGGRTVAGATAAQLEPLTDHLEARLLPDSGHIIPLDRPRELLELLHPFLGGQGDLRRSG
ncbi:alpha/beta hydrolase [Plantibacter sp. H53]|uniref:alpha/beta fold hydrolase n=1 Tax=Plantibacter sp. H53 TaxID=1827323 RepID=UPI0007D93611|nr:alpha/beta hydrolase [Plantibacter sp. H53]OAN35838.1 alpha/beta hydrolase [Plantibacter sp. H53]